VSTITTFVTAFDAKALNCTELWKYYLAGGNRILLTATGKPTEIATIDIVDKTHGLRFLLESHHFFSSCVKKKNQNKKTKTLYLCSICGGMKTLKHNMRTTLQLAYHGGCKIVTHTSKTSRKTHPNGCRFTVRVFLTFSYW